MEKISFDDFIKLEIRIGKILTAERVEDSNKLLKLSVDFGTKPAPAIGVSETPIAGTKPSEREVRQVIAGIGKIYAPEALIGKECPFAYNLAPRMLKGLESQGMILCPSNDSGPVLLHPDKEVPPGTPIK